MKKTERIFRELKKSRLVALLAPKSAEECVTAYEMLVSQGIILEIAFRSEPALKGMKAVVNKHREALFLAGTVMTAKQAEEAISAGAAGIVSADYIPSVVDVCVKHDIMCVPGGLSDCGKQLVQKAEAYGCSLEELQLRYPYQWVYKLFPAFSGGVSHLDLVSAWKGPFRDITVIYTGGITLETLPEAVEKDPAGIFCASALARNLGDSGKLKKDGEEWKKLLRPQPPKSVPSPRRKPVFKPGKGASVVTFGEIMLRLSPPAGIRLAQANTFDLTFGGAEANVAVALAQLGMKSVYVTALPPNEIGDKAVGLLRMHGVDTGFIIRRGGRMGIYYLEHGSGPRPSKVIYDRSHSAISQAEPADFDWEAILKNACWFHWTGITPALSESTRRSLTRALETAKERGITVSADLNFRKKLWKEEEAREVMTELMGYVDICIGNEEDPARVFGIEPEGTDVASGKLSIEGYRKVAESLAAQFGFQKVAITLRESISASENNWSACLFDGKHFYVSQKYHVWIDDRVGAGDAFAAGLIYSLLEGRKDVEALSFGVAAACFKHSISGDFLLASAQEIERLAAGETTGRIQR